MSTGERRFTNDGTAGNGVSTPSKTPLQITGDIDLRAKANLPANSDQPLVAKTISAALSHTYGFERRWNNLLTFRWKDSSDVNHGVDSTLIASDFYNIDTWYRVTLDVDDGNGNHVVTFYTSSDGETWTVFEAITVVGTTDIKSEATTLYIAKRYGATATSINGSIYRAQVYDGIDGTMVADWDAARHLTSDAAGATSTDQFGNVWTLSGTTFSISQGADGLMALMGIG